MPGEEEALNEDVGALMVLRHYGVPTRLLDWSLSPFIAAYLAALGDANKDGEIWAFDHNLYVQEGSKQWEPFGGFKQAEAAAFLMSEPKRDWFVCYFYQHRAGFLRQKAQQGFCSMTPRFGCDHANAIADLLKSSAHCCRYVIDRRVKPKLRKVLQDSMGSGADRYIPTLLELRTRRRGLSFQNVTIARPARKAEPFTIFKTYDVPLTFLDVLCTTG